MNKSVVVVDYGIGNLFSVCNALRQIGAEPILSSDPKIVMSAERIILPGVGAFSKAMENLRRFGLDDAIQQFVLAERPFLGICIGMQILMDHSSEFGSHKGLGLISGKVVSIQSLLPCKTSVRIPHIGWQLVEKQKNLKKSGSILNVLDRHFYFVHSFACAPSSVSDVIGTVHFGGADLCAAVAKKNMLGVQFHPERSGSNGLAFLRHFMDVRNTFLTPRSGPR